MTTSSILHHITR